MPPFPHQRAAVFDVWSEQASASSPASCALLCDLAAVGWISGLLRLTGVARATSSPGRASFLDRRETTPTTVPGSNTTMICGISSRALGPAHKTAHPPGRCAEGRPDPASRPVSKPPMPKCRLQNETAVRTAAKPASHAGTGEPPSRPVHASARFPESLPRAPESPPSRQFRRASPVAGRDGNADDRSTDKHGQHRAAACPTLPDSREVTGKLSETTAVGRCPPLCVPTLIASGHPTLPEYSEGIAYLTKNMSHRRGLANLDWHTGRAANRLLCSQLDRYGQQVSRLTASNFFIQTHAGRATSRTALTGSVRIATVKHHYQLIPLPRHRPSFDSAIRFALTA